jgi:hypothetical protein
MPPIATVSSMTSAPHASIRSGHAHQFDRAEHLREKVDRRRGVLHQQVRRD